MRQWINLFEQTQNPEHIVQRVLLSIIEEAKENGYHITPHDINNGQCFEFADEIERVAPDIFQSMSVGQIFKYQGKYEDDPYGFDEKLLNAHWKGYQPFKGYSWDQMFNDLGMNWPGTHAWAHCKSNEFYPILENKC